MQLVIDLPDKIVKRYSKSRLKEMLEEKIKEEENLENDPFFKWAGKTEKCKEKDLAKNHDKYLYGNK